MLHCEARSRFQKSSNSRFMSSLQSRDENE